jgi:hypothetical protein
MTSTTPAARLFTVLGTTEDVTDCQLCGRSDLRGTIALQPVDVDGTPDGEPVYYGSDCGARAAGWGLGAGSQLRDAALAADRKAAAADELAAERRAAYTIAEVALSHYDWERPELQRAQRTFHASGGFDALGPMSAWVAHVAATGDLGR